jgi:monoamine oxidase
MSFEAFLYHNTNGSARARATAKVWSQALVGCDPGEISALFILDYIRTSGGLMQMRSDKKGGGQYMRIKDGVSAFSEGLVQRLAPGTLKLNSPVRSVMAIPESRWTQVTTSTGVKSQSYLAKRIIMAIPSPVYRTIIFSPPLSPAKRAYVDATRYASYTKYLIVFKKPFWREKGYCGLAQSFVGPVCVFRDTSIEDGEGRGYCFTGFVAGGFGRSWSALSASDKQTMVLKQISQIFNGGKDVTEWFVEALESPWMSEEYSGWGCPIPTLPPGVLSTCWDAFVAPEGSLHFVGNETATVWRGYMDGAISTAERGAAEVTAALKSEKAQL